MNLGRAVRMVNPLPDQLEAATLSIEGLAKVAV
jgi:hypothetical protein